MTDVEDTVALFNDGLNCCQAILSTYGGLLGLARESSVRLGTGFGGGIARNGEVCGAVNGAVMVIGIKHGMRKKTDDEAKEHTYELVNQFIEKFKTKHGSIICKDILECDLGTPEGREQAKEKGLFKTKCPELVRTAAELLEEIL
jgi:C_GCAxxG_C_C family probable redox protein